MPKGQAVAILKHEGLLDRRSGPLDEWRLRFHKDLEDVVVGASPDQGKIDEQSFGVRSGAGRPLEHRLRERLWNSLAVAGAVGLGKFLQEERVALSPLVDRTELRRWCISELRQRLQQLKRVIRSKRCQVDGGDVRPPRYCRKKRPQPMPAMKLVTSITSDDQVWGGRRFGDEKLHDGQGSLVRPMQVLNQENGGRGACIQAKRTQKRPEQAITVGDCLA